MVARFRTNISIVVVLNGRSVVVSAKENRTQSKVHIFYSDPPPPKIKATTPHPPTLNFKTSLQDKT